MARKPGGLHIRSMVKHSLLVAGLLATGLLLSVRPASADLLHYVVTGLVGTATFDLPQTPTVLSPTTQDFLVSVNNGTANLWGYHFSLPPFTLEFSNWVAGGTGGGLGVDGFLGDLQLTGAHSQN